MVSRAQRTPFAEWWWTVDKLTLAAFGALMLAGVVLSLAASPPVAGRLGLEPFYFVNRHILFLAPPSRCCWPCRSSARARSAGSRSSYSPSAL